MATTQSLQEPTPRTGPALLFPALAGGAGRGPASRSCGLLHASCPSRRHCSTASSLQTHSGRRWREHRETALQPGLPTWVPAAAAEGGSAERPVPGKAPVSPGAAGSGSKGSAGEETLPVSGEIYHLSLSCRSLWSSLCPLRLRVTCPRMHVTTCRRAWCVRGERLLQQQGQSLSDPSAATLLPLPAPSPTPTWPHSAPQPLQGRRSFKHLLWPLPSGSNPAHSRGWRNPRALWEAPWLRGWLP